MNKNVKIDPENLLARIDYLEKNGRLIQNALEMALSLGDFQENINKGYDTEYILREAEKRIRYLHPKWQLIKILPVRKFHKEKYHG